MIKAMSSAVASGFVRPADSMPNSTTADLFETSEAFCIRSRRHATLGYCLLIQFLQNGISKREISNPRRNACCDPSVGEI